MSGTMLVIGLFAVVAWLAVAGSVAFSSDPFVNTSQGDLLLAVSVSGGAVSGFLTGYQWRKFIRARKDREVSS